MSWSIQWNADGKGVATHTATGASFLVSRSGWVGVRDAGELSDDDVRTLIAELHDILVNVSPKGASIH